MEQALRIAVLIDAENISSKYIKLIIDEVTGFGTPTYKRVYGNFTNSSVSAWQEELRAYALTPVFQFNYTKGKNASDSAIIIDAMDILYSGRVDGFCLVTSDSDFTKLALRLREAGMLVIGMGEQKTPGSLVSACETFKFLDLLYSTSGEDNEEESVVEDNTRERSGRKKATPSKKQIRREIKSIIDAKGDEEGWTDLSIIGNLLSQRVPGFDPRNYRFNKLGKMIESYNDFEMKKLVNEKNELIQFYFRVKEDPSQKKRTSVEILSNE
ncbi:MAG: NYN domain-containing protein [Lachnospiraceae bacterium]|nr:NYN domain-containing protein [Lachnospiraceae bacterium]